MYAVKHPIILWALGIADELSHMPSCTKTWVQRSKLSGRAVDIVGTNTRCTLLSPRRLYPPTVELTEAEREIGKQYKLTFPALIRVFAETLAIDELLKARDDVPKEATTRYRDAGVLLREFKNYFR